MGEKAAVAEVGCCLLLEIIEIWLNSNYFISSPGQDKIRQVQHDYGVHGDEEKLG